MSLNPWVALIIGFVFGWLAEWLLELWFFRRRRLECQQRLADVERDLRTRDAELRNVRAHAESLAGDLTALRAQPLANPAPETVMPDVAEAVSQVEAVLPEGAIAGEQSRSKLPDIDLPEVDFGDLKDKVVGGLAAAGAGLAALVSGRGRDEGGALEGGQIEVPQVEPELPAIDFDRLSAQVEAPEVAVEALEATIAAPQKGADLPDVGIEKPKLKLPDIDLPEVDFGDLKDKVVGGLAAAGAGLAALVSGRGRDEGGALEGGQIEVPQVEPELPAIDFDRLSAQVEAPEVAVEAPEVELPDAVPPELASDVHWPAISAALDRMAVEAPAVGVETPSLGAELPDHGVGLPESAIDILTPHTGVVSEPDDLTRVPGIGPKYAALLADAGITSFAGLSAAQPEQLKAIINAPEWRQTNYGAWVAGAKVLDAEPRPQRAGDDLTQLEGIGPVYAAKLNAAGINTFAELAAVDEARLHEVIAAPAWRRVNYGEWIQQAGLAAAGDWEGLAAVQAELFGRKGGHIGLVSGVGEKTAQALTAAGITSFAALAAATPEQLAEITRSAGVRGGDFGAWIDEAKLRAAGKRIVRAKPSRTTAKVVSCPQDLSRAKGIGSVYEQKLYAAGIGSYWDLAHAEDGELATILGVKEFQDVDLAAIKADALRLAEETGTTNRSWDGTAPDDFEPLEGIGEVYEGRLYNAGICTFRALANTTVEQLADICKAPEWRKPDYAAWISQAKRLIGQEG